MRVLSALVVGVWVAACASPSTLTPEPARPTGPSTTIAAPPKADPSPAVVVEPSRSAPMTSAAAAATKPETTPSFPEAEQRLRAAGWPTLADILAVRVTQTRRKMKLTEEEAARAAVELVDELPAMPHAGQLLEPMPKAMIELVRSVRERGVTRDEAEQMAEYLLQARTALDMDNPGPFDENCSHVVGREWQDIDYRDEGMTWQKQSAIYAPKGIPDFKSSANLRQFFRVESTAPYFQKLYRVKGSAP